MSKFTTSQADLFGQLFTNRVQLTDGKALRRLGRIAFLMVSIPLAIYFGPALVGILGFLLVASLPFVGAWFLLRHLYRRFVQAVATAAVRAAADQ